MQLLRVVVVKAARVLWSAPRLPCSAHGSSTFAGIVRGHRCGHHTLFTSSRQCFATLPSSTLDSCGERSSYKVVLLQPPGSCKTFTRSNSVYPPLGLCQLAATVPEDDCYVLDAEGLNLTKHETIHRVATLAPVCIGFTVTTMTMPLVNDYAAALKQVLPQAIVLAGGPQATAAPATVLQECTFVDAVFRGEGEAVFPSLVATLQANASAAANLSHLSASIPGIATRSMANAKDASIQRVPADSFVKSILPFPTLDKMPLHAYWCPDALRSPMVTFMTARGCPFKCAFCATPQTIGNDVRGWDPVEVATELERLTTLGVKEISFVDDLFTAKPSRVRALCQEIIRRNIDITWFANSRADRVNAELCRLMKQAGCHQIFLGVESGSPKLLKYMRKGETVETMIRGSDFIQGAGIKTSVGFIIGLPGETDETVQETIALAQRLRPNRIQFSRWTPLAGSALVDHPDTFAIDPREAPSLERHVAAGGVQASADAGTLLGVRGFHSTKQDARHEAAAAAAGVDRVDRWIEQCYAACGAKRTGEVAWGLPSL